MNSNKTGIVQRFAALMLAVLLVWSPAVLNVSADTTLGESGSSAASADDGTAEEAGQQQAKEELKISSEQELRELAERVNGGDSMADYLVTLTADLVVDASTLWIPIGSAPEKPFSGEFDGQGFSVRGLRVGEDVKGGLFGYLANAKISRLVLADFYAPDSTGGFFYAASGTTIDLSRTQVESRMTAFSILPMAAGAPWTGSVHPTWGSDYGTATTFVISDPDELAKLSQMVNAGSNFSGKTIVITQSLDMGNNAAWIPIGTSVNKFKGTLVGLGNIEITRLNSSGKDGGLFGYTEDASVSNITFTHSDLSASAGGTTAMVAADAVNTNISKIVVRNCVISAASGDAAGIVGIWHENTAQTGASIRECVVDSSAISAGGTAAGILVEQSDLTVSDCAVYGGSIRGGYSAGIVGTQYGGGTSYSATTKCLVFGVDFSGSGSVAGIGSSNMQWFATSNCVVSDVKGVSASDTLGVKVIGLNGGIQHLFTDASISAPLVDAVFDPLTLNNHWDDISGVADVGTSNKGYNTTYLTNGSWAPAAGLWFPAVGYYPQISSLKNSAFDRLSLLSDAAAIAILPGEQTEQYTTGVKELHLPRSTAGGRSISWSGYQSDTRIDSSRSTATEIILFTKDNGGVPNLTLTAGVNGYQKNFAGINLVDSVLELASITPADNATNVDSDTAIIKVSFVDPIQANADLADLITLSEVSGGTIGMTQVIEGVSSSSFILGSSDVELKFTSPGLRPGVDYVLTLPAGMVQESGKDNFSERYEIRFSTAPQGAPIIQFTDPTFKWPSTDALSWNDLLQEITVYDQSGGAVMYSPSSGVGSATEQPSGGLWDDSNPLQSMDAVLRVMANGEVRYHLDDTSILSAAPEAGTYRLYVMAKNNKGYVGKNILPIAIQGVPQWQGDPPKDHVHIPWTANRSVAESAGKQGAIAIIPQSSGVNLAVPVKISIPDSEWLGSVDAGEGPTKLNAVVYALDQSGAASTSQNVVIYLDRPLYWTATPSPFTMSLSTKRQVEEKINFFARNFPNDVVEYDHWEINDYRKPGKYVVDLTSDEQNTTLCLGCDSMQHPENRINGYAVINMIQTPGVEIDNVWGNVAEELESDVYSQSLKMAPVSHLLPMYIPEALAKQQYGHVEVDYESYRWNFYSNTLDHLNKWSDYYDLEVNPVNNRAISAALGKESSSAIQLRFNHEGRLFGTVGFDINIGDLELPNKSLGLYRYDSQTEDFKLVSDVTIVDGKWASALLNEIYPAIYVLKPKAQGDKLVRSSDSDFEAYYQHTRVLNADTKQVEDNDPILLTDPIAWDDLIDLIAPVSADLTTGAVSDLPAETDNAVRNKFPVAILLVALAAVLVLGGIGLVGYRIAKNRKGEK